MRERSEPNRAKCPHEVRGVQNERRQCDSKTKRKHAEENTGPQKLICVLPCSLAGGGPPDLAVRRKQHAYEKGGAQDHADDVPTIEVLDRGYEEETKHKRSNCSPIGIGKELADGGGVNAHCGGPGICNPLRGETEQCYASPEVKSRIHNGQIWHRLEALDRFPDRPRKSRR